jgi:wobble nucleotide-excising tRNase
MNNEEIILEHLIHIRRAVDKISEDVDEINKILSRIEEENKKFDETMQEKRLIWKK